MCFTPCARRKPSSLSSNNLEAEGNELVSLEIATPSLEGRFHRNDGRRLRD